MTVNQVLRCTWVDLHSYTNQVSAPNTSDEAHTPPKLDSTVHCNQDTDGGGNLWIRIEIKRSLRWESC